VSAETLLTRDWKEMTPVAAQWAPCLTRAGV
jgi:hypothetical protein